MAKRKAIKKKTYPEFMAWLEGVECMQEPDWTPTQAQWVTIREMLNGIKPNVIERESSSQSTLPANAPVNHPVATHEAIQIVDSAGRPTTFGPVGPSGAPVERPPQRLVPSALKQVAPAAPGVPAATTTKADEVLDTSDGVYNSEFT